MQIFVDGYNVTMRDPDMARRSKEDQRDMLVARLRSAGPRIFSSGKITVIFDARDQWTSNSDTNGSVRIVYAPDADTDIVGRCERAGKSVTVVTDDMRLRARLSQDVGRHISFVDTSVIWGELPRKRATQDRRSCTCDEGLPRGSRDITKELEALWLDGDEE